jgi:hypothetical protein
MLFMRVIRFVWAWLTWLTWLAWLAWLTGRIWGVAMLGGPLVLAAACLGCTILA